MRKLLQIIDHTGFYLQILLTPELPIKIDMYRSLLIFCAILLLSDCIAQDLVDSRTTSSDNQALRIARQGTINSEEDLFYSKVDSFPTGTDYQGILKPGNYLKVFIDKDKIDLEYFCTPNIHVSIVDNQTDLILQLRNHTGETVTDALMRIGGRRIPFDEKTGSYSLKKANCRGIISVGHDGMTSLIRLERRNTGAIRILIHFKTEQTPR